MLSKTAMTYPIERKGTVAYLIAYNKKQTGIILTTKKTLPEGYQIMIPKAVIHEQIKWLGENGAEFKLTETQKRKLYKPYKPKLKRKITKKEKKERNIEQRKTIRKEDLLDPFN